MSSESESCACAAPVSFSPSTVYEYSLAAVVAKCCAMEVDGSTMWSDCAVRWRPRVLRLPIQRPSVLP